MYLKHIINNISLFFYSSTKSGMGSKYTLYDFWQSLVYSFYYINQVSVNYFFSKNKCFKLEKETCIITSLYAHAIIFFCFLNNYFFSINFNYSITSKKYILFSYDWIPYKNLAFTLGFNGLSFILILLTLFIIPFTLLTLNDLTLPTKYIRIYIANILFIELFVILAFLSLDLFIFFIFFEAVLIPMFLIIGIFGSRNRRKKASFYFYLYTLFGSIFFLLSIVILHIEFSTTNLIYIEDILFLTNYSRLNLVKELFIWLGFFLAFSSKIPMIPLHIWLPEAHVEAPTAGSIILASLLLKLGGYGLIRFNLTLFPSATIYFLPLVYTLSIASIIYASLSALRQIDLKKIIAYSSIAHMNVIVLGIFSLNIDSLIGSIYLMIGHGFVSSALFFLVGILYRRFNSRLIYNYGGLVNYMPLFVLFFFLFTLCNTGVPGTFNFIGEFLILMGLMQEDFITTLLAGSSIFLGAAYSFWMFNRVSFGTPKDLLFSINLNFYYKNKKSILEKSVNTSYYADLTKREFTILLIFFLPSLFFGVFAFHKLITCKIFLEYITVLLPYKVFT